jgi:hypothetical protein
MYVLFFLLLALFSSVQLEAETNYSFKDSAVAENIFARIDLENSKLRADKRISFGFLIKTNETTAIYFPKREYFCQMQLLDSSGIPVPKTVAGQKYGQQFSGLKAYAWDLVNKKGYNTGGSAKPDMILPDRNNSEVRYFPAVKELFKINNTDSYILSLKFQVFIRIGDGTNHIFKIVRIPSFQIHVIELSPTQSK